MKLDLAEFKNSFYLKVTAETVEESSMLLRFVLNTVKKPARISTNFNKEVESSIIFDKKDKIKTYFSSYWNF